MNIKLQIKRYIHQGYSESDAINLSINDAQQVINDMDTRLTKTISFLSEEQVNEIYQLDE